jgi:hypothetical protein
MVTSPDEESTTIVNSIPPQPQPRTTASIMSGVDQQQLLQHQVADLTNLRFRQKYLGRIFRIVLWSKIHPKI